MRPARWLFAWLFLFFALGTGGHLYSPDAVLRGRATEGLVLRGSLAVDPTGIPPGFLAPGRDGKMYSKFDWGLPRNSRLRLLASVGAGTAGGLALSAAWISPASAPSPPPATASNCRTGPLLL